jgi:hypothetical protein
MESGIRFLPPARTRRPRRAFLYTPSMRPARPARSSLSRNREPTPDQAAASRLRPDAADAHVPTAPGSQRAFAEAQHARYITFRQPLGKLVSARHASILRHAPAANSEVRQGNRKFRISPAWLPAAPIVPHPQVQRLRHLAQRFSYRTLVQQAAEICL